MLCGCFGSDGRDSIEQCTETVSWILQILFFVRRPGLAGCGARATFDIFCKLWLVVACCCCATLTLFLSANGEKRSKSAENAIKENNV